MTPTTVLLTGFEPFEDDPLNPSWEVARALDGWSHGSATVRAVQLPCVFDRAISALHEAVTAVQPELVICMGLASGREQITPERVAINVNDARIADNAGAQPIDTQVVAGGPAAYFSRLPIKAMVRAMRDEGVPAAVSNTAGTFVCNHVFYGLMHHLATLHSDLRGGFIHVPADPVLQALHPGMPGLTLAQMVTGLRACVRTALEVTGTDLYETGGRLS